MQTKTWALATAFALAVSTASAEPARPRIYFPREVRRQFQNGTSTSEPTSTSGGLLDDLLGGGDATETSTGSTKGSKTTDTDDGILIGPTGIVIPGLIGDDETTTSSSGSGSKTKTNSKTATGTKDKTTTATGDNDGSNNGTATATATDADPTSTSGGGLLDPLPTLISDILGPSPTTTSKTGTKTGTKTGSGSATKTGTKTGAKPTTTSEGGLLDPLPTLISDILGPSSSSKGNNAPNATSTSDDGGLLPSLTLFPTETSASGSASSTNTPLLPTNIIPSLSLSLPGDGTSTSGSPSPTDGPNNSTIPENPTPTSFTGSPTLSPTDLPEPPINATSPVSPTTPGTVLPTTTADSTPDNTTSVDAPSSPVTPSSKPVVIPTSQSTPEVPVVPTTTEGPKRPPVTSIVPTATFSNTDDWLPTTIVADPTSFTFTPPKQTATGTSSEPMPTGIPDIILPNDPDKPIPEGSTEISIGFLYALNYNHVANNTVAAAQIFNLLPQSLAHAGDFDVSRTHVSMLVPMDTRYKWGYITTLAKVYYPENKLDSLEMDLWSPNSLIYHNPKPLVNDLSTDINPKIDIYGNIKEDEDNNNNSDNNDDDNGNNDAIDSGDSGNSSAKQAGTTAGIAVGAFGLAALYGGAMFIVARRYKRKRQGHRRASSLGSGSEASSEMRYANNGSPAMMGGALMSQDMSNYGAAGGRGSHGSGQSGMNNSARTANISAPVAAENSLGWN